MESFFFVVGDCCWRTKEKRKRRESLRLVEEGEGLREEGALKGRIKAEGRVFEEIARPKLRAAGVVDGKGRGTRTNTRNIDGGKGGGASRRGDAGIVDGGSKDTTNGEIRGGEG